MRRANKTSEQQLLCQLHSVLCFRPCIVMKNVKTRVLAIGMFEEAQLKKASLKSIVHLNRIDKNKGFGFMCVNIYPFIY